MVSFRQHFLVFFNLEKNVIETQKGKKKFMAAFSHSNRDLFQQCLRPGMEIDVRGRSG